MLQTCKSHPRQNNSRPEAVRKQCERLSERIILGFSKDQPTDHKTTDHKEIKNALHIQFFQHKSTSDISSMPPKTFWVHLCQKKNHCSSHPIGTLLPHAQHIREFDVYCEILIYKKI
jgi:hypothetical protein